MVRLLIWVAIFYLLLQFLRKLVQFGLSRGGGDAAPGHLDRIDDMMVQDPYCQVYFPKKTGHHLRVKGLDLYFCSPECLEKYRMEHAGDGL